MATRLDSEHQEGLRAGAREVLGRWYPALVFVVAIVALMPQALAGRATYIAVDMVEATSPYRDTLDRAPDVESPIQTDQVEQTPPVLRFMDELQAGNWQLWEPRTGLGTPTATTFPWLTSPFNVVYLIAPGWYAASLDVALTLLVGQLLMFLFLRGLRASRAASTFGAVAFAFTGTNMVFVQRPLSAALILPGLLWAVQRMVERRTVPRGLVVGGFVAWCWFEGFPSMFAYSVFTAVAWAIWLVVRRTRGEEDAARPALATRAVDALRHLVPVGLAFVWGALLAMITLLPFASEVSRRGLLELRDAGLHSHLPNFYLWGLWDLSVNGNPLDPGSAWGGVNPYESVSMVGSIVILGAFVAMALAVVGRFRLERQARDAWSFFVVVPVFVALLTFIGTRVLGWMYLIPGIASNPLHRARFLIPLGLTVLAVLLVDRWLDRDRGGDGVRAPRVVTGLVLVAWVVLGAVSVGDLEEKARIAGERHDILVGVGVGLAFAGGAAVLVWLGRRRWLAPAMVGSALAGLAFAQLGWPLRDFTPESPVEDFYRPTAGYEELERLGEGRYRFASTTFNYYPNSASLMDLYDVRGLVLYDEEIRTLLAAANPLVFSRDPLKQLLYRDEVRLGSAVYDHLALRHFVLATAEIPYGDVEEPVPAGGPWLPLRGDALEIELDVPAGRTLAGVAVPLRADPSCAGGQVQISLVEGSQVVDEATKPALDAVGTWFSVALVGRDLQNPHPRVVIEGPPGCPLEGTEGVRIYLDDPEDAVELVSTEQGWIYERPTAWPIVSAHSSWRWFDDQDQLLAAVTAGETPSGTVLLVGEGEDVDGDAEVTLSDVVIDDDEVRATVTAEDDAVVVLAQDESDGWRVEVDGDERTLESVDGALMGVRVPAGTSDVTFSYAPTSFRIGAAATGLAVSLGVVGTGLPYLRRRPRA